jgi:predicted regulator of Ras-like GTPase activity (Roadblock/LC7/MglB family)
MSLLHSDSADLVNQLIEIAGVYGVYRIDNDGFLLESIAPDAHDPEAVAASGAIVQVASERIGAMLGLGAMQVCILEFRKGTMVLVRHASIIWVVITVKEALLGEILKILQEKDRGSNA